MKKRTEGQGLADPKINCPLCRGAGWVQDEQLTPITRETIEGPVKYAPPMRRCSCVYRNSGSGNGPPRPEDMPGAIDQIQRAAGERSDS